MQIRVFGQFVNKSKCINQTFVDFGEIGRRKGVEANDSECLVKLTVALVNVKSDTSGERKIITYLH